MLKENFAHVFAAKFPDFFAGDFLQNLPGECIYEEMFLPLAEFSAQAVDIPIPNSVTFGYFDGNRDVLLQAVSEVDDEWPQFFGENDTVFCAFVDGKPVSFCLLEDMGTYQIDGRAVRFGGPGCVGTVPEFRRQGIGLAMVQRATGILKESGYDYSYIHYTGVAPWYAKLGYRTELRWNRDGIL